MSAGFMGHDPLRVAALHGRVRVVVDDLAALWCADPAAAEALSDVAVVRSHLEAVWLPLVERVGTSSAMTAPLGVLATDDGIGPPSSLDAAAARIDAADGPAPPGRADQAVLSNGWSWTCGPVSATTGQRVSGCEFMPPTGWDLVSPVVLVASVLPVTGELVDGYDCVVGAVPCEATLIPFFSGRAGRAFDEVLDAAGVASRVRRSVADVLMPGGVAVGRRGSSPLIREVMGTLEDAEAAFVDLSRGGTLVFASATRVRVQRSDGGYVQLRTTMSRSPATIATIDVSLEGYEIWKIKFNP